MGSADEHLGWSWDPSLSAGSARHYASGRVPYPAELAAAIAATARLDGTGLLLDVGCGPGSLTLPLLPYVGAAIGVDADLDMLRVAARIATERGLTRVTWGHVRAEELPADLARMSCSRSGIRNCVALAADIPISRAAVTSSRSLRLIHDEPAHPGCR
ncbi:MAG TPA: class I SAM-dependent methyltransferase [Microlunatus sp.]|nr:class I SAM-dependent methyltransferase [Microlunatus sp.]